MCLLLGLPISDLRPVGPSPFLQAAPGNHFGLSVSHIGHGRHSFQGWIQGPIQLFSICSSGGGKCHLFGSKVVECCRLNFCLLKKENNRLSTKKVIGNSREVKDHQKHVDNSKRSSKVFCLVKHRLGLLFLVLDPIIDTWSCL